MKESDVPHMLRETLIEVVENQIRDGDPIETRQTFERLLGLGLSEDAAHRLIAGVLAAETLEIVNHGRDFDAARYADRLHLLPEMPWLDDDTVT